jgi:hypothetical protein
MASILPNQVGLRKDQLHPSRHLERNFVVAK